MKIKKRTMFFLLVVVGLVVLARYVMRDIRLDVDLLRESLAKNPGVTLENLEFEREISGDLWRVRLPFAERRDGRIYVTSMDIRRQLSDGKVWYFWGAEGVYREEEQHARLGKLLGTMEAAARVMNLESPELLWSQKKGEFLFPRGLTLYDAEFILKTPEASMDESGAVMLDKGGSIRWTKPLR